MRVNHARQPFAFLHKGGLKYFD